MVLAESVSRFIAVRCADACAPKGVDKGLAARDAHPGLVGLTLKIRSENEGRRMARALAPDKVFFKKEGRRTVAGVGEAP